MLKEEITITFNLENEPDNKIYYVLKNLTKYPSFVFKLKA